MTNKLIEIEAESLEKAREKARSLITEDMNLLSEKVISDGKPKTVTAVSDTTEMSFRKSSKRSTAHR